MGACEFWATATGATPEEAFQKARDRALHEYGHNGYTGTIAEKNSFIELSVPLDMGPTDYADKLLLDDARINDKWGPAGCVALNDNTWLFFGWAAE